MQLSGAVISECYSQEKAELIVRFETAQGSFHLRANLSSAFTSLSFPKDFERARKNSVDLFPTIVGHRVTGIVQHQYDRSFVVTLSDNLSLLFKLHGNRSNIILYQRDQASELFRSNLEADRTLDTAQLNRTMDKSYEAFERHQANLPSLYFTFGKIPWLHVHQQGFATKNITQRWESINELFDLLDHPRYYLTRVEGKATFSLLPVGEIQQELHDPLLAATTFSQWYRSREGFDREYTRISTALRKRLAQSGEALQRAKFRLSSIESYDKFKVWADLLMANPHVLIDGNKVMVPNFYNNNQPEEIRVQPDLSVQKNASLYYAKSKKRLVEMKHLQSLIANKAEEFESLTLAVAALQEIKDIKSLRSFVAKHPLRAEIEETESLPFRETEFMGFRIMIGKNAQANDILLQRFGYKDDLWLHAKDVAGSHVLIKHQAGKVIPRAVIEHAAALAAWHSKRKTDTLCPVIVTPRKYVRKRKGDPAGMVVVEREKIVMVKPEDN